MQNFFLTKFFHTTK